jgi:hypothetical protein
MSPGAPLLCAYLAAVAQPSAQRLAAGTEQRQPMEQALNLLQGRWRGTAWVELEVGHRQELDVTILAEAKAEGTALLLDVAFSVTGPRADERGPHNEIAVLYFDEKAQAYRFDVYFASGRRESGEGRLEAGVLQVVSVISGGGSRRLTIDRSRPDEWRETGERSDDGSRWRTYYDSRLRRVEP